MFEGLFYITGALSVSLLILLLTRHEKLGEAVSQVEALKRENAELHKKLKDEAEDFKHLLNHLRSYYEKTVERKENVVGKIGAVHKPEFDDWLDGWLEEERKKPLSPWMREQVERVKSRFPIDPPARQE